MAKLEDLTQGAQVKGIDPSGPVAVINTRWFGSDIVELTYRDQRGQPHTELLYRDREPDLDVVGAGIPWAFDADGELFRLVSEAYRIRMAYLFDPWMAVHLSQVEPLPHQISAVYGEMLPRQPLRFLLADDPGAGKTIMTGLFIKELMLRGDLVRCLIVTPGNLVEQWQDELYQRFHLPFDLLTNDRIAGARTGNALAEMNLVIARLDKLSRDNDLQDKAGSNRLGSYRYRRSPQDVGFCFWWRNQIYEALSPGTATNQASSTRTAADSNPTQWKRRRLPTLPGFIRF
jgi:hypothetical protein